MHVKNCRHISLSSLNVMENIPKIIKDEITTNLKLSYVEISMNFYQTNPAQLIYFGVKLRDQSLGV